MRILVGSKNAWNDMNAVGNTLSNWFYAQEDMEFSSLYSRSQLPANRVCSDYFRITETQMLRNIFAPENVGSHFTLGSDKMNFEAGSSGSTERRLIDFVKEHSLKPVYTLSDKLWADGRWANERLKNYIKEFNPDIFFSFATEPVVLRKRMELVKELCNSKCVLFVADDVYSVFLKDGKKRVIGDFEWCMNNADYIYAASEEMCKEYSETFKREFHFLCKGCEVSPVGRNKPASPIRLVYAGNLFYGRDEILALTAQAVEAINRQSETKLFLEIYTASPVADTMQSRLNVEGASKVMGAKPYSQIVEIMRQAHIVLQVESFDKAEIEKVRLSFSTKISDCLQSGSAVVAIGPDGISSIEYLKKVGGATVITDTDSIADVLSDFAAKPSLLSEYAEKTNKFALENIEIKTVRKKISDDFKSLLRK